MLQSILYGSFVPPQIDNTRKHRIGFNNIPRYVEPRIVVKKAKGDEMNMSERFILSALRRSDKDMSASDIAPIAKMTKNHCGILLSSLYKRGNVTRYKVCEGAVRYYRYRFKDAG